MAEWILLLSQQLLKLSVQRLLQHIPEDAHATRQLYCQLCSGPFHAKRPANASITFNDF